MKALCLFLAVGGWVVAQESIERLDPKLDALIPPDAAAHPMALKSTRKTTSSAAGQMACS